MSRPDHTVPQSVWDAFVAHNGVGDVIDVRVTKVLPFGVFVEAAEGIPGLLHGSARHARPESTIRVQIDGIDAGQRRLSFVPA